MAKSVIAEILIDHAISVAKRFHCDEVSHVHLVGAARRWQEDMFDARFPGISAELTKRLEESRGTATFPPSVPQVIDLELEAIRTMATLWEYLERVILSLQLTPLSFLSPEFIEEEAAATSAPQRESFPFPVTNSLIERVASFLNEESQAIRSIVLGDLWWISRQVIGHEPHQVLEAIGAELEVHPDGVPVTSELSALIKRINRMADASSNRVASELALAYNEHADWSALVDDNYTPTEIERVDDIRVLLIGQLDNQVHPEVLSTQPFDANFSDLVGMEDVKSQIRMFVNLLSVNSRRMKRGKPVEPQRLHMAFLGNPGTGKTTVARKYGNVLRDLGLLKGGFRECDAGTFTGTVFVGESQEVMQRVLGESIDGVLFIDEAHGMNDKYSTHNHDGPGLRATNTLVKYMEDWRDRLCVILAGYTNETMEYIQANPGLPSRIGCYVYFDDIPSEQMPQLIERIASRKRLELAEGTLPKLAAVIEHKRLHRSFGNARTIEKVLELAERRCISRCAALGPLAPERTMRLILPEDIDSPPPDIPEPENRNTGYL